MKRNATGIFLALLLTEAGANHAAAQGQTPEKTATAPEAASSAAGRRLTLEEAEAIALRNNPQITVGKLKALVAGQLVREARSSLLPTANLSLTAVDSRAGSRIAAGALNNPVIYPRAAAGVTVSQLITDFGRTANLLSSSESAAKEEEENAAATRAQILLAVDHGFYNVLEAKALMTVANQTVESRGVLVEKIRALTGAKLKSDLDLSFVKVDAAKARLLQLESRNNYEAARAGLSALLGYEEEQNFEPVEDLATIDKPVEEVSPLIERALHQRPEVLAFEYNARASAQFSRAEHDLSRPTVSALGAVGLAPVRDDHINNWYGAVGVNVNIPIFTGFLYDARAKAADLEADSSRQGLAAVRNSIARDVRITWQENRQAYERLDVTRQFREQANLAMDLADSRYKLGLSSIVEFTQAELAKTEADIAETEARYRYRVAQIELAFAIGERH
jgi:outer membrane protein